MSETFIDRAEQAQRRAADPGASVWVGASAGTGKTKVLTDRVLTLLLGGTPPERILCLTFTKAAAAEMANRIAGQLSKWTTQDDDTLAAALTKLTGTAPDAKTMVLARRLFARCSIRRAACISRPSTPSASPCSAASRWKPKSPHTFR